MEVVGVILVAVPKRKMQLRAHIFNVRLLFKTEARQQAAFIYKVTRLQSGDTLGLDTTRVT